MKLSLPPHGSTGGGGQGTDTLAWHNTGDTWGATKKLGSLDAHDVSFVWNNVEVCHLGWELELPGKNYYYLKFVRTTDEGQYVQCLQEQSQGTLAYVAIELTNWDGAGAVFADHDLGVAGHGYVEPFPIGVEADDLFVSSNQKLLLTGTVIKFWQRLTDTSGQECFRIDDGTTSPSGATGGIVHFVRNSDDNGAVFLIAKNAHTNGVMELNLSGDTATSRIGITGSINTTYGGMNANEAYVFGVGGGVCLNTNGSYPVRLLTNEVVRYQINGDGTMGWFAATPVARQTVGANVNNVAASGTTGQFDDFTSGTVYATDYAGLHNTVYQLTRSVAQLTTAMRNYGLGA